MEPHKSVVVCKKKPDLFSGPDQYFADAKDFVLSNYIDEVIRISELKLECVTPDKFFSEYIWTVHTTGFSAKAVGKFFPRLAAAYGPFSILATEDFDDAFSRIRTVCNNAQKAKAVWSTAKLLTTEIANTGWGLFRDKKLSSPSLLQKLPYVGKITCFHLARNIGLLEYVKPDLHLVRMAQHWGFKDCQEMCESMQKNDKSDNGYRFPLGIIDLILWYSASEHGTIDIKVSGSR